MNKTIDALRKMIASQKQQLDGVVEGTEKVMTRIDEKNVLLVVIATDITDQKFLKNFHSKAAEFNTNVIEIGSRDDLGVWLGHCKFDKNKNPIQI